MSLLHGGNLLLGGGLYTGFITPSGGTIYIFSGTSTTWSAPFNCTSVVFECWGPGGGGTSLTNSSYDLKGGSGGGGGAYAKKTIYSVSAGQTFSLVVGSAGSSGIGGNPTIISSGVTEYCKAAGGNSDGDNIIGSGGQGGQAIDCIGDIIYAGGNGGAGCNSSCAGGDGGGGAGSTGPGLGSVGADEFGGQGGAKGAYSAFISNNGLEGNFYGSGGGGCYRNTTNAFGGAGKGGLIRITYTA